VGVIERESVCERVTHHVASLLHYTTPQHYTHTTTHYTTHDTKPHNTTHHHTTLHTTLHTLNHHTLYHTTLNQRIPFSHPHLFLSLGPVYVDIVDQLCYVDRAAPVVVHLLYAPDGVQSRVTDRRREMHKYTQ
jgi:hypothetical protein